MTEGDDQPGGDKHSRPKGETETSAVITETLGFPGGITYSQTEPGKWDLKQAQHELKASTIAFQQQEQARANEFERQEQAKERGKKRLLETIAFFAAITIVLGSLTYGGYLIVGEDDDLVQQAGLAIVSVVLGGVAGGIGGYLTGRNNT